MGEYSFQVCVAVLRVQNNERAYQDCEPGLLDRSKKKIYSTALWNKKIERGRASATFRFETTSGSNHQSIPRALLETSKQVLTLDPKGFRDLGHDDFVVRRRDAGVENDGISYPDSVSAYLFCDHRQPTRKICDHPSS